MRPCALKISSLIRSIVLAVTANPPGVWVLSRFNQSCLGTASCLEMPAHCITHAWVRPCGIDFSSADLLGTASGGQLVSSIFRSIFSSACNGSCMPCAGPSQHAPTHVLVPPIALAQELPSGSVNQGEPVHLQLLGGWGHLGRSSHRCGCGTVDVDDLHGFYMLGIVT